ncbi:UNKNOWN [Stylonychia lemnae]|uniref:Uncharacterized protein n=1 Tax=Stylonychia lemnae TaxID=5949 RepID=A0A078AJF8_STYLE|nr:UNKNOWN [Stylonychia lemnae]|eukprot:CDW82364.1 UNKNOWN [Stylonychia lemnae]
MIYSVSNLDTFKDFQNFINLNPDSEFQIEIIQYEKDKRDHKEEEQEIRQKNRSKKQLDDQSKNFSQLSLLPSSDRNYTIQLQHNIGEKERTNSFKRISDQNQNKGRYSSKNEQILAQNMPQPEKFISDSTNFQSPDNIRGYNLASSTLYKISQNTNTISQETIIKSKSNENPKITNSVGAQKVSKWTDDSFNHLRAQSLLNFERARMGNCLKRAVCKIFSKIQKHTKNLQLIQKVIFQSLDRIGDIQNFDKMMESQKNAMTSSILVIESEVGTQFYFIIKYFREVKQFYDSLESLCKMDIYLERGNPIEILKSFVPLFIRKQDDLQLHELLSNISQGLTFEQAKKRRQYTPIKNNRPYLPRDHHSFLKEHHLQDKNPTSGKKHLNLCDKNEEIKDNSPIQLIIQPDENEDSTFQNFQTLHQEEIDFSPRDMVFPEKKRDLKSQDKSEKRQFKKLLQSPPKQPKSSMKTNSNSKTQQKCKTAQKYQEPQLQKISKAKYQSYTKKNSKFHSKLGKQNLRKYKKNKYQNDLSFFSDNQGMTTDYNTEAALKAVNINPVIKSHEVKVQQRRKDNQLNFLFQEQILFTNPIDVQPSNLQHSTNLQVKMEDDPFNQQQELEDKKIMFQEQFEIHSIQDSETQILKMLEKDLLKLQDVRFRSVQNSHNQSPWFEDLQKPDITKFLKSNDQPKRASQKMNLQKNDQSYSEPSSKKPNLNKNKFQNFDLETIMKEESHFHNTQKNFF